MFVDGKKITEALKEQLRGEIVQAERELELLIVQTGSNPVSNRYVNTKKKFGESLGVRVTHLQFPSGVGEDELIETIQSGKTSDEDVFRGIIVQLPLLAMVDIDQVLNAIPLEQDVDLLSEAAREEFANHTSLILPPVVGAVEHIFAVNEVDVTGKKVAVVGYGRLVGKPVSIWLEHARANVTILTEKDPLEETIRESDIIISGTGVPNLIKPDMLKEGVILVDVGTSDAGGELLGDIDLLCAAKASLFSSVPGGIGPITMAMLFKNLVTLAKSN